jgi:hypothetical protein
LISSDHDEKPKISLAVDTAFSPGRYAACLPPPTTRSCTECRSTGSRRRDASDAMCAPLAPPPAPPPPAGEESSSNRPSKPPPPPPLPLPPPGAAPDGRAAE